MSLRRHGTPAECQAATRRLAEAFGVVPLHGRYPGRGPSRLLRVDRELRPNPAAPAGPGRRPPSGLR